ncbi:hypothetical protein MFLAVUS_009579 [Mucor flavus]|uniref:Transposase Tc1-like domain-containing protein n=1 Tax=Mucor flavus TaxID=439312 RepID=A0ABP9ZAE0_9FUNG
MWDDEKILRPHQMEPQVQEDDGGVLFWSCITAKGPGYGATIIDGTVNSEEYVKILDTLDHFDLMSLSGIRKSLRQMGFKAKRKFKANFVSNKNKRRRLAWAKKHKHYTVDQWRQLLFQNADAQLLLASKVTNKRIKEAEEVLIFTAVDCIQEHHPYRWDGQYSCGFDNLLSSLSPNSTLDITNSSTGSQLNYVNSIEKAKPLLCNYRSALFCPKRMVFGIMSKWSSVSIRDVPKIFTYSSELPVTSTIVAL